MLKINRKLQKFNAENQKSLQVLNLQAFEMVRLAGIEPTTPWFVAKYSIQLSYSRSEVFILTHTGRACRT